MNINEHRVREFAYQIWESEGRPQGQEERHWDMACKLADAHAEGEDQQQAASGEAPVKKSRSKTKSDDTSSTIAGAVTKSTRTKKPKSTEEISA
jgi:hypothetical protein